MAFWNKGKTSIHDKPFMQDNLCHYLNDFILSQGHAAITMYGLPLNCNDTVDACLSLLQLFLVKCTWYDCEYSAEKATTANLNSSVSMREAAFSVVSKYCYSKIKFAFYFLWSLNVSVWLVCYMAFSGENVKVYLFIISVFYISDIHNYVYLLQNNI